VRKRDTVVTIAITAFLLRGTFYCVAQPLWEGFDEWSHYAYIEHLVTQGRLPSTTDSIAPALQRALSLAPLAPSAAENVTTALTHDAFWRLTTDARRLREEELKDPGITTPVMADGPGQLFIYEAQQPPLYYILLAFPYWSVRSCSYPAKVAALRMASLLIAVIGVYLCYRLARGVPASRHAATAIVLFLAAWPGLLVGICRIGNDALALTLSTLFLLVSLRTSRRAPVMTDWILAGSILGLSLLTKPYLLALVPVLPIIAAIQYYRQRNSRVIAGCAIAIIIALALSGWWYMRNWLATETLSGEQIDVAAAHFGIITKLAAIRSVQWYRVLDTAVSTHLWTGGWSFLTARSWIYRAFELPGLTALIGLALLARRTVRHAAHGRLQIGEAQLGIAACAFLLFCMAMAYFAVVVYLTRGMSIALGWHLYGIAGAEMVVLAGGCTGLYGLRRGAGIVAIMALFAAAFDGYSTNFIALPYYAGIITHAPDGRLGAFHMNLIDGAAVRDIFQRLAINKPSGINASVIAVLWTGYACATLSLAVLAILLLYRAFRAILKTSFPTISVAGQTTR